jgi:nucleoid DNA-binding protein
MTKKDIVEIVANSAKDKKNHIKMIVETVFDVFMDLLAEQRRVEVRNFGVFKVTKEIADVPARKIVQFKAGKTMKDRVMKPGSQK